MFLNSWKRIGRYSFDEESLGKSIVRCSESVIPSGKINASIPAIRMIITNQHVFPSRKEASISGRYDVYLEDCEYGIKTNYGTFSSIEQAMFIADLKLIELGYSIDNPFYL